MSNTPPDSISCTEVVGTTRNGDGLFQVSDSVVAQPAKQRRIKAGRRDFIFTERRSHSRPEGAERLSGVEWIDWFAPRSSECSDKCNTRFNSPIFRERSLQIEMV